MSVLLNVHMPVNRLPTRAEWQAAIEARGFSVVLDEDLDLVEHSGFLPCTHAGERIGFEYYYDSSGSGETAEIGFRTGSHLREYITAAIAGAVLAEIGGGILEEPQDEETYEGAEATAWARDIEASCQEDLELEGPLPYGDEPEEPAELEPPPVASIDAQKPWWRFW